ncbi:MAG: AAA domain-containing protein [Caldithrix sp.]|nr:AAA domain-containing protein [Caldithrix sp.]
MDQTEIIGHSSKIRHLLNIAKKLASSPEITVLIEGENGTGKELFARRIHQLSQTADNPFVDINCGAIPESLLESELFGHEKGAFTGATDMKKGLFEIAEGGTIFLDEIASTSLNFQSKLLKAVENKRIRHIGGIQEVSISTRIIAATNINLYEAIKRGQFREDLFYRLNIGRMTVPPLREREEDIELLVEHFIETCNQEYNRSIKGIRPKALERIKAYPWPGNVRQLKHTIERAILIESEDWIEPDDLDLDFELESMMREAEVAMSSIKQFENIQQFDFPTQGIALEELEKGIIESALNKASGNLSEAARLLKISRGKLRYRLEKLGIHS